MKILKNKFILYVALASLLLAGSLKATAQRGEIGLRFMPTFTSLEMHTSTGNTVTGEAQAGLGYAVFGSFNFTNHVGIQAEVIYSSISQKYKEFDVEREINLRYVNIPLLLSLNTGKTKLVNFNLVVGPQLGISVGSDIHVSSGGEGSENTHAVLSVKTSDIGFAYGAGVDVGLNPSRTFRLGLGFRGVYGLLDISDNSQTLDNDSFYILEKSKVKTYAGYIGCSLLF